MSFHSKTDLAWQFLTMTLTRMQESIHEHNESHSVLLELQEENKTLRDRDVEAGVKATTKSRSSSKEVKDAGKTPGKGECGELASLKADYDAQSKELSSLREVLLKQAQYTEALCVAGGSDRENLLGEELTECRHRIKELEMLLDSTLGQRESHFRTELDKGRKQVKEAQSSVAERVTEITELKKKLVSLEEDASPENNSGMTGSQEKLGATSVKAQAENATLNFEVRKLQSNVDHILSSRNDITLRWTFFIKLPHNLALNSFYP